MKKHLNDLLIFFLFCLVGAASYFYIPRSVKTLSVAINQSSSQKTDTVRGQLLSQYDTLLRHRLPENNPLLYSYWFSSQRKLSDLRVKRAISEIGTAVVEPGEIKVWALLNMGVVIETSEKTIAIDVANLPFSTAHNRLIDLADVFLVTHMDSDHYDRSLLKKALAKGKRVAFLTGFSFEAQGTGVYPLNSGEPKDVDGVTVTAYQTDHRGDGDFSSPCAWLVIETGGYKLLHTGDGRDFKDKGESAKVYGMKDFDVLLANRAIHPYNLRDLKPKVLIPLHLYKFMSGGDLYRESTIEAVSANYQKYAVELKDISIINLLPGEGYLVRS